MGCYFRYAHLASDFHQIVDSFKEVGLVGARLLAQRRRIKVQHIHQKLHVLSTFHHFLNIEVFAGNFRQLVTNRIKRYGNFEYDVEAEIERYKLELDVLDHLPELKVAIAYLLMENHWIIFQ
ncbi:9392_t:CDS:2, partial [Diversispora eburnea]